MDKTLRVWDWRNSKQISKFDFSAQIFTLGICPIIDSTNMFAAVGLEDSNVEVVNLAAPPTRLRQRLQLHESCVLSLKYASSGDWFVTGGKDKYLNVWKAPYGGGIVRKKEQNSILSVDIAPTNQYIGTGSWEKLATIYKVLI